MRIQNELFEARMKQVEELQQKEAEEKEEKKRQADETEKKRMEEHWTVEPHKLLSERHGSKTIWKKME